MTDEEYMSRRALMIDIHAQGVAAATGVSADETRQTSERQTDELLPQGVQTPGMLLFVGVVADQPVGWVWIGLPRMPDRPDTAWVYYVGVDPGHRAKGYGRELLLAAERELTGRGVRRLALNVHGHNTVAIGLYQSLGFEVTAQQMAKPLPAA
ncbi:GNAT family N-acetyltransferase [Plantactinospora solaniradicis]|uniref:GNAT family N-acetyltransferase n=1 Tax=Plantactinospora solaniradicis TaxID=1723736 RepID=A0ABW1K6B5_9ACTN